MFEHLVNDLTDRITPAARNVGNTASAYLERIIANLEAIHDAVQSEEWNERRVRMPVNQSPFNDTTDAGEDWLLELVTVTGACTVTIAVNNQTWWTHVFAAADTVGGASLLLPGNSDIRVTVTAGQAFLQWKARAVKARHPKTASHPRADVTPDGTGHTVLEQGRHSPGAVKFSGRVA